MTSLALAEPDGRPSAPPELIAAIASSCDRIAPTWPLDQFIAVNPYWGWRSSPIETAAGRLAVLAGTPLTMPRSWFREEWRAGRLSVRHLTSIAIEIGDERLAERALAVLGAAPAAPPPPAQRMALITDLRDQGAGPIRGQTWTDLVVHQISQHCASHFDEWQASWVPDRSAGLLATWRVDPSVTHGFSWTQGSAWATSRLQSLPVAAVDAIATILDDLAVEQAGREAYLTALLASVNGWAAWCAYRRWQARLIAADDDVIVELLAIRLAWEWLLAADLPDEVNERDRTSQWASSWTLVDDIADEIVDEHHVDWLLQTAIERTFQNSIAKGLPLATSTSTAGAPDVQAAFCIDVRSEVYRRALEATSDAVQTRGFAGFFGLPIDYRPTGTALTRPQLPGLLAPALHVTDSVGADDVKARVDQLHDHQRWEEFRHDPSSVFSFVESMGLLHGVALAHDSLRRRRPPAGRVNRGGRRDPGGRPRLGLIQDDPAAAAALGHRILTAIGLRGGFAPLVMLCGHGSTSANNPHAAGLDCGACGGQTGEINARVLAALVNAPAVRQQISELGIDIPDTTWFIAALHDTTTDDVELFDTDLVPPAHRTRVARLASSLALAGQRARTERAARLWSTSLADDTVALRRSVVERASDWSQVRPEWGLAGNAAFVVAPRSRTRHIDLHGRSFLHDYDWRLDADLSVLTLIMTAPMVVTNWINLQYYASTVDNQRYGSGNKVLHNVVGGHIGVFEGNGGDLRIGLAEQSLHDGITLQHPPLRLSVFIEAPPAGIEAIIAEHAVVRDLVANHWLHLLRIEPDTAEVERWSVNGWGAA